MAARLLAPGPVLRGGDRSRRFIRAALLPVVGCLALQAGSNWIVNPWNYYSPRVFEARAYDTRALKCNLLRERRPRPELLLLGSSRLRCLDPELIEQQTGLSTFNAAVTAATPIDFLTMYRFARETEGSPIRGVVIGIEAPTYTGRSFTYPLVLLNRDLRPYVPMLPEEHSSAAGGAPALPALLSSAQTRDAFLSVRHAVSESGADRGDVWELRSDGYARPERWERARRAASFNLDKWTRIQMEKDYVGVKGLDPVGFRDLETLLRLLKTNGVETTLVATPMSTIGRSYWRHTGQLQEEQTALDRTHELASRYGARYVDFSKVSSFGGDEREFMDAVHPTAENCRRMVMALFSEAGSKSAEGRPAAR